MQERFLEDLNRRLLSCDEMGQEEKFIIFNSLLNKYKKVVSFNIQKSDNMEANEIFKNVIKSLPRYSKYFDNCEFSKSMEEYKKCLPEDVEFDENDLLNSIINMINKVTMLQAELGKFSKNSGVNIINDKTNYTNNIADFEIASQKFTPEFIEQTISKMGSIDAEMAENYKKKYEYLCKSLAENAIKDKMDYYDRTIDYLVDFYSDNEIARREEMQIG